MRNPSTILAYLLTAILPVLAQSNITFTPLNVTALSSRNGYSVLECWQLASVPVEARSAVNYALGGNTTSATWSMIEPRTTVGEAWAPAAQLTMVLNGLVRITAPSPVSSNGSIGSMANLTGESVPVTTVAYMTPGTVSSSVLLVVDTPSVSYATGHYTEFPSDEPTVLIQIPFLNGAVPGHLVLYDGSCRPNL